MATCTAPHQSSSASLPEEMQWICCVQCKLSPGFKGSENVRFFLSSCGHIYCSTCKSQERSRCVLCGRTGIKFVPITLEIRQNPQVGHLFCDTAQSLKQLLEVLSFQEMHIKNGRAHDRQKASRASSRAGCSEQRNRELEKKIEEKRQQTIVVLKEAELLVKEMRSLGLQERDIYLYRGENGEMVNAAHVLQHSVNIVQAIKPGPSLRSTAASLAQSISKSSQLSVSCSSRQQSKQSGSHTPMSVDRRSAPSTQSSATVRSAAATPRNLGQLGTAQGSAVKHDDIQSLKLSVEASPQSKQSGSHTPMSISKSSHPPSSQAVPRGSHPPSSQAVPRGSHPPSRGMPKSFVTAQGSAVRRASSLQSNVSTPQSISGVPLSKRAPHYGTPPSTASHQFGLNLSAGAAVRTPPLSSRGFKSSMPPPPPPPTLPVFTHSQPSHPHNAWSSPLTRSGVSPRNQEMRSVSPRKRRTPSHVTPSPQLKPQRTPTTVQGGKTSGGGMSNSSPFKTHSGVVGHATRRGIPGQSVSYGHITPSPTGNKQRATPTPDSGRLSLRPRPTGGKLVGRTPSPLVCTPCSIRMNVN